MTYYDNVLARYLQPGEKTLADVFRRTAHFLKPDDNSVHEETIFELLSESVFLPNSPTLANVGSNRGGCSACYVLPLVDSVGGIYRTAYEQAQVHAAFGGTGFDLSTIRPRGDLISSSGGEACGPCAVLEFLNQSAHLIRQGGKREGANMGVLYDDHPDLDEFISYKDSRPHLKHFNISVGVHEDGVSKADRNDLLMRIAEHSHATGDPGVLYVDRFNTSNLYMEELGSIRATNPCGEVPLRPYECCNLGSINLSKFVDPAGNFDYEGFKDTVNIGIRLLDRVIDVNHYPLDKIAYANSRSRKTGLGIMGWADALIKMGISYQSTEAKDLIHKIGPAMQQTAVEVSRELGDLYGNHEFGVRRNETLLAIAPTGTLSYFAGCSGGIEPNFGWDIVRETEAGETTIKHPLYDRYISGTDLEKDTAHSISAYWQIIHQAAWQAYVDNAVSKTINLPKTATIEDFYAAYQQSFEQNCKGVTIYRDGSKNIQTLRHREDVPINHCRERPATIYERKSGCGTIYVIPSTMPGNMAPWDTFAVTSGGCAANSEAIGRLISGWMQEGGTPASIRKILHSVDCPKCSRRDGCDGLSCADIIGNVLVEHYLKEQVDLRPTCPNCGFSLNFGSGCGQGECPKCGWSGCN